jgi:rod shape determining protein RodA
METANKSWLVVFKMGSRKIMIQPSEFVKLTLTCTFAKHLDTVKDRVNHPVTLAALAVHAGAVVGLIFLSGDYGVALIYAGFLATMLLCAGMSLWYFAGAGGAAVLGFPLAWKYVLKEYHRKRIIVGFNPELDPEGKGWQPLLSKDCIANGGFFGIGLMGKGDYEVLPASHTDFIFATVCEKFGIFGGIFVVILLLVMLVRILLIARSCGKDYGSLICVGVAAIVIVQTIENIGMCLAMLPVVGLTLPFLSCGGSSVLATYVLLSLVHSIKGHKPKSRRW